MSEMLALKYALSMALDCEEKLDSISRWFENEYLSGNLSVLDADELAYTMMNVLEGCYADCCPVISPLKVYDKIRGEKGIQQYLTASIHKDVMVPSIWLTELFCVLHGKMKPIELLFTLNGLLYEIESLLDSANSNLTEWIEIDAKYPNVLFTLSSSSILIHCRGHLNSGEVENDPANEETDKTDKEQTAPHRADKLAYERPLDNDGLTNRNSDSNVFASCLIPHVYFNQFYYLEINYFNFKNWVNFIKFIIRVFNRLSGPIFIYNLMDRIRNNRGQRYALDESFKDKIDECFRDQYVHTIRKRMQILADNKARLPLNWKLMQGDGLAGLLLQQYNDQQPNEVLQNQGAQPAMRRRWLWILLLILVIQLFCKVLLWLIRHLAI